MSDHSQPQPGSGVTLSAQGGRLAIGGDVVGRDKIVNNIQHIVQRALTAAEEATGDRALEQQALAQGVSAFAVRLQGIASETADTQDANPYKGLPAYSLGDAEIFFGRSAALAQLFKRLGRGSLTVLHAEAGAGKSSLVQAGLSPRLIAAGHLPVYLRVQSTNPALLVKRAFLADPGQAPLLATASLHDFLRQVSEVLGPETTLYILLDQAERLFTEVDEGGRAEFVADLADCLGDASLAERVLWLLVLRAEFFDQLSGFQPQIQNPLENEYHLRCFSRAEVRAAMVEPARQRGLAFEEGLPEMILDDLGSSDVPPAQLQLVCSALFDGLPAGEKIITRAQYDSAGGAAGILGRYATQSVARDFASAPAQRASAQSILEAFKAGPRRAKDILADPRVGSLTADQLAAVLSQLVESRLLRVVLPDPLSGETEIAYASAYTYRLAPTATEAAEPEALPAVEPAPKSAVPVEPRPLEPVEGPPQLAIPRGPVAPTVGQLPMPGVEPSAGVSSVIISAVQGEITIAGDVVGRDKIINNIQNIVQRALTAAEEAVSDRSLERQVLAQGVSALARRLQAIAGETTPARDASPYKGLLAYRLSDAEIFFGRSQATAAVLRRLQRGAFTVIHSESGAGKSSLVQAGIAPRLIGAGHLPLYLRPYNANPVQIIKRAFIADPSAAPLLATAPLRDFLRQASEVLGPQTTLFIILDQAEELFTQLDDDSRAEFIAELAECLDDPSLNVRWVLSLRTESFGSLANFRPQVQNPFENDFRLNRLTRAEAAEVVIEPARQHGLSFEAGLVDELLGDLGRDNLPPPQLQLVCSGLYDGLPLGSTTFTRAQYAAAGGASGILRDHLARVMGRNLKPAQRPIAQRVFESLITADGRRAVRTLEELRADLSASQLKDLTAGVLAEVLNQLVDSRLLRAQEKDASAEAGLAYELASGLSAEMASALAYELAHDYLLDQIRLDPDVQARKAAQELLDQEVRTYQRYQTLLTPERLAVIAPHRASLRLTPDAEQLLAESEAEVEREKRAEEARRQKELEDARKLAESERKRAEEQTRGRRRAQRLALVIAGVGVLALIAAVVAVFFSIQSNRNALLAQARELAAAAVSNLEADPELSILLALQSVRTTEPQGVVLPEAEEVLHEAVETSRALLTLTGHTDEVGRAVFSPDGQRIATASDDQTVKIWDAMTGKALMTLTGHNDKVSSVAYSPDGTWLATASEDGTARIWDAATGREVLKLSGHEGEVWVVAFSPDGKLLATGGEDSTARIWDAETGEEALSVEHDDVVYGVAFSPDGAKLATASADQTGRVWDVEDGEEQLVLSGHEDAVYDIAFNPDGTRLATASGDETAKIWDAETGDELETLYGHTDLVSGVAFSPAERGARLATASLDRTVNIWETATGQQLFSLKGHFGQVVKVAFSPVERGMRLVSAARDKTAKVWDVSLPTPIHTDQIFAVRFSPDGQRYATAGRDGAARIWEVASHKELLTLNLSDERVYDAAFSPDGTRLVTAAGNPDSDPPTGSARVWDAASGAELLALTGHTDVVYGVAYSPDGKTIATTSWDGAARLWDAVTGDELLTLAGESGDPMRRVAFSPDGQKLATTSDDQTATVWDVASGASLLTLTGHTDLVFGVAFSADGKKIATASWDSTGKVWDAATGQELLTLSGHNGPVWDVAFSPAERGARLATASADSTIILWDASTGRRLITLFGHTDVADSVAFSPDGARLATTGQDQTVHFYTLPINQLTDQARSKLTRPFTLEECEKYLQADTCPAAP